MLRFPLVLFLLLPMASAIGTSARKHHPEKHEHAQKHFPLNKNMNAIELGHSGEAFTKIERDVGIWYFILYNTSIIP